MGNSIVFQRQNWLNSLLPRSSVNFCTEVMLELPKIYAFRTRQNSPGWLEMVWKILYLYLIHNTQINKKNCHYCTIIFALLKVTLLLIYFFKWGKIWYLCSLKEISYYILLKRSSSIRGFFVDRLNWWWTHAKEVDLFAGFYGIAMPQPPVVYYGNMGVPISPVLF